MKYLTLMIIMWLNIIATALVAVECVYAPYISPVAKSLYSKSSSVVQAIAKGLVYGMRLLLT